MAASSLRQRERERVRESERRERVRRGTINKPFCLSVRRFRLTPVPQVGLHPYRSGAISFIDRIHYRPRQAPTLTHREHSKHPPISLEEMLITKTRLHTPLHHLHTPQHTKRQKDGNDIAIPEDI